MTRDSAVVVLVIDSVTFLRSETSLYKKLIRRFYIDKFEVRIEKKLVWCLLIQWNSLTTNDFLDWFYVYNSVKNITIWISIHLCIVYSRSKQPPPILKVISIYLYNVGRFYLSIVSHPYTVKSLYWYCIHSR